jgi:hypothetical protein
VAELEVHPFRAEAADPLVCRQMAKGQTEVKRREIPTSEKAEAQASAVRAQMQQTPGVTTSWAAAPTTALVGEGREHLLEARVAQVRVRVN